MEEGERKGGREIGFRGRGKGKRWRKGRGREGGR